MVCVQNIIDFASNLGVIGYTSYSAKAERGCDRDMKYTASWSVDASSDRDGPIFIGDLTADGSKRAKRAVRVCVVPCPQQPNGYDCGLFLLMNYEREIARVNIYMHM